jgi:hypothetical protein
MTCHTPEAGHALSFNTRQLNAPGGIAGVSGNLLGSLASTGSRWKPGSAPISM